jgi:hypothetical protein
VQITDSFGGGHCELDQAVAAFRLKIENTPRPVLSFPNLVEDVIRFARDLLTQELGILLLIKRGVTILTSSGEDLTQTDDPMKKAMRQIAGVYAQLEKHRLVVKLRGAVSARRPPPETAKAARAMLR